MAVINEKSVWEPTIYQVELQTPVIGGVPQFDVSGNPVGGYANIAVQQLANRSQWLLSSVTQSDATSNIVDGKLQDAVAKADIHYGSGGYETHALATQISSGFLSPEDKKKIDDLQSVAFSGSYNDLDNKPHVDYTVRSMDFTADIMFRYFISDSCTAQLPDPLSVSMSLGDYVSFYKAPNTNVYITSVNSSIITAIGSDTRVSYDVNDEIIFVFDGTDWRVQ